MGPEVIRDSPDDRGGAGGVTAPGRRWRAVVAAVAVVALVVAAAPAG